MSTPSQREIVQSLVYKHRLETESAYMIATRLIEGAEEFKAALTVPPEKDAFTLKDPELNSLVNLAVDLTSGVGTQETGMEFAQVLSSIEARLIPKEDDREYFEAYIARVLKIPATRDAQGAYVHLDARTSWHVWQKARQPKE